MEQHHMLEEAQSWVAGRRLANRGRPEDKQAWATLVSRYDEAVRRRRETWARWRQAEDRAAEQAPPPEELAYTIAAQGRRVHAWFEDEQSVRRAFATGAIDARRMDAMLPALHAWRSRREAALAAQDTAGLRAAAEEASEAADSLRRELFAASAPDLDAVAYKMSLLPQVIDDLWDFTDPKIVDELLSGGLPDRETSAVMAIYFDVLRLNGRAATVERMRRKAVAPAKARARKAD